MRRNVKGVWMGQITDKQWRRKQFKSGGTNFGAKNFFTVPPAPQLFCGASHDGAL